MNDKSLKGLPSFFEVDCFGELGIIYKWISIALKLE